MTPRDKWVIGSGLLKQLVKDELVLARALRERRWADVAAAAEVARKDVDPEMALTDPAQYRTLRDAITIFHIKGYGGLDIDGLWAKVLDSKRNARACEDVL